MKYLIVALDSFSDQFSALLVQQIRRADIRAEFVGVGGIFFQEEIDELIFEYSKFSRSDERFFSFYRKRSLLRDLNREFSTSRPDILIAVGSTRVSSKIVNTAKSKGIKACLITNRVDSGSLLESNTLLKSLDRLLLTLPVDENYSFPKHLIIEYVGHPAMDLTRKFPFKSTFQLDSNTVNVAICVPDDRTSLKGAIRVVKELASQKSEYTFWLDESLPNVGDLPKNVNSRSSHRYELLKHCNVAVCFSSLGTLEATIFNCPTMLVSKEKLRQIDGWSCAPNLVTSTSIVKEFVGRRYAAEDVLAEVDLILKDQHYCATMLDEYQKVKNVIGHERASKKAARLIVDWLEESSSS